MEKNLERISMVLQYILKVLFLQPRLCLELPAEVDEGGLDVVVQELDPLLHLPSRLHHSVELHILSVHTLEPEDKGIVAGRWVVVPDQHRLGRLLLEHQGVDGLEHLPDVRLRGKNVHGGVPVHRDHLLVGYEVEPRTVGSLWIQETLHCISKLLEHVVDVIKLHGYRSLGQCLHNIWFLCHFLQDLLEVLGHRVVGLKQEWLVPLKKDVLLTKRSDEIAFNNAITI